MLDLANTFGSQITLFLIITSLGLFTCILIEQSQILVKYKGFQLGRVAGGYNSAMKIMVINRIGTVLFFFFCALSIDLGAKADQIAVVFLAAVLGVAATNVIVLILYSKKHSILLTLAKGSGVKHAPIIASYFASFFGILGLTIPMLLSAQNPELRLTMANTGFFFNAIFTVLVVFFVENYLAELIDQKTSLDKKYNFLIRVYLTRLMAALSASLILFIVYSNAAFLNISILTSKL